MNNAKQFWTLFKFQTFTNPSIWILPFVFVFPLLIPMFVGLNSPSYHPNFYLLFSNQNLFFLGIFGVFILAPEKYIFGNVSAVSNYYGVEFLLTRAIDRPVLYRSRAALLYALFFLIPFVGVFSCIKNPDLVVDEDSKIVQQACLASVPGSSLLPAQRKGHAPSLIAIPRGNVLVMEWQIALFLVTAMALQILILAFYDLKYGRIIFRVLFFGLIFSPIFYDLHTLGKDTVTFIERLFFIFAGHQILFWILTAIAFVLTQLWCERRYTQLEQ